MSLDIRGYTKLLAKVSPLNEEKMRIAKNYLCDDSLLFAVWAAN